MSERGMRRAHRRNIERTKRSAGAAAVFVGGAGLAAAPAADAADFTVTTNDDSGAGSLRQAIADANAAPTDDNILFASNVTGEIRLTTGQIQITADGASGNLSIQGPGEDVLAISGDADDSNSPTAGDSRIFDASGGGALTIDELTFRDGYVPEGPDPEDKYPGGAIRSSVNSLTITDSTFTGNTATKYGGALSHTGTNVDLSGLTVTDNQSTAEGGGVYLRSSGSLADSTFTGNAATSSSKYGAGGGVSVSSTGAGGLTVEGVTMSNNAAATAGGGLFVRASGNPASVTDVQLTGNDADNGGGMASYVGPATVPPVATDVTIAGNTAATAGGGVRGGWVINDSVIVDNDGSTGGAGIQVQPSRSLELNRSTVANNTATAGTGGIEAETTVGVEINRSTIAGNDGTAAGGIRVLDSDPAEPMSPDAGLTLVNSTVSGNSVTGDDITPGARRGYGGGIYLAGEVGGRLENSTVSNNSATVSGGGVFSYAPAAQSGSGTYITPQNRVISSTIVANNAAGVSGTNDLADVDSGTPDVAFDLGFSLVESPGSADINQLPGEPNVLNADPQLGPLGDNGGPTQSHRPAPGSPAIDAGTANGLTVDQRGNPRTNDRAAAANADDGTDIGSVEIAATVPSVEFTAGPANGETVNSSEVTFAFTSVADATFECSLDGAAFAACTSPVVLDGLADGGHTFQVRATGEGGIGPVAERAFTVDATVTGAFLDAKKKQKVKKKKVVVKARFGAEEETTAIADGKIKIGKKQSFGLEEVEKSAPAGGSALLKLVPESKKALKKIVKAIKKKGKKGTATIEATISDSGGNETTRKRKVKLK